MQEKKDLGFLGPDFQYRLAHHFMDDKKFFRDVYGITDANMFTDINVRKFIATLKDYYEKNEYVPSYEEVEIELRSKSRTGQDIEFAVEIIKKIKTTTCEGADSIKDKAYKFFKQQNLAKVVNKITEIIKIGDIDRYGECEHLITEALSVGNKDSIGIRLRDNLGEVLSDDYREPVPVGIKIIDDTLEGGLGKGELGLIVGGSGFGKALSINELVCTVDGFKKIGDLTLDDKVIGRDGKPHNLLGIYPQGERDIYTVKFSDGVECDCDMEHLWDIKEFSDKEYKTLTLKEIVLNGGSDLSKYQIPKSEVVEFNTKELPEEPFEYGKCLIELCFKFIPEEYLYNSVENRIKLLKGIVSVKNKYIRKNFYNDFNILCRSLKLEPIVSENGLGYSVDNDKRYINSVTFKGKEEAICIKVDAEDQLFLTSDFIVTHNTTITTAMVNHDAMLGYNAVQIVFEDKEKQIQRKHISRITNIEARNLSKAENIISVRDTMDGIDDFDEHLIIKKFNTGEISPLKIKNYLKTLINTGFKPDVVTLDYFECLIPTKNIKDQWEAEAQMMRQLEAIAGELDIALWVATQGNRNSMSGELITLDKASGSFKKIQIAHVVMTISRSPQDILDNIAKLAILKNRAGQTIPEIDDVYFNNGTCIIHTDNAQSFNNWSDIDKKDKDEQKDLIREMLDKRKKEKEQQNNNEI